MDDKLVTYQADRRLLRVRILRLERLNDTLDESPRDEYEWRRVAVTAGNLHRQALAVARSILTERGTAIVTESEQRLLDGNR